MINEAQTSAVSMRFYLLGDVHIERQNSTSVVVLPRSTQGLLVYLLVYRDRSHSREVLADRLWSEQEGDRARASLSTALWRLRGIIEPNSASRGTYLQQIARNEIKFNTDSPFWLDLDVLETIISAVLKKRVDELTEHEITETESALELYRGDLLEGYYGDWAVGERERLRALYLDGLWVAMEHRAQRGGYQRALAHGHKALRLEPIREDIHRMVMDIYARSGRAGQALLQFDTCRRLLRKELGIAPMQETIALRDEIARQVKIAQLPSSTTHNVARSSHFFRGVS
jgi:DNA-binding SARP family transcriptional activator